MLGSGEYAVTLSEWSGRIIWQSTDSHLESLGWGREAQATSKASLEAVMDGEVANRLEPWIHRLTIYRNGDLVWHGPVVSIATTAGRVSIEAADGSAMFTRRRIASNRTWRQHDATQVMRTMVEDALGYLDPVDLVESIETLESRLWVTATYVAAESMVAEAVEDLEKQGLMWTVAAGRLLIGPVGAQRTTQQITDRHFDGSVTLVKDGAEMVTDALVTGKGVWGVYTAGPTPYGMLQAIEKADGAVREQDCIDQARRIVEDAQLAPRRIVVEGNSRLLPSAPVSIAELIPGVHIPIASAQTGVMVGSTMQLKKLDVDVDKGGEKVKMTLSETSLVDDPAPLPDPSELDWRSPYEKENAGKNTLTGSGGTNNESQEEVGLPPA